MKQEDLKQIMNEYCNDIVFRYAGKHSGVTCEVNGYKPTFQAWHGDTVKLYSRAEDVLSDKFYSGKSINDLLDTIDIDVV